MTEQTFFSSGEVSVTNTRFMAKGQTYAMSGITSVKSYRQDPSVKGPALVGILGIIALLTGKSGIILGLILIAVAVGWWRSLKPEFSVLLSSASGEVKALASKDEGFIRSVINALNDAIVHRG
jgi:hypothetical protein